jgi:Kef-type K+ transport system membrane component KefB
MEQVWFLAATWLFLALVAVLLANLLRISTALSEIVVGTVAQVLIGALVGTEALGAKAPWIAFLAGTGAIVLTFLAGAELDPQIFRTKWKESLVVGLVGFFCPFHWRCPHRAFRAELVLDIELAVRCCTVYNLSRSGVRGDAGVGIQPH